MEPNNCSKTVESKVYRNHGNAEVLKWIPSSAQIVLDLGCGAGDNAKLLTSMGITVDGVTLSQEEASLARSFCKSVWVYNLEGGLPKELADHKYDVVIASHVFEHICFPENLLNDIKSVLKPNGRLIIAIPNLLTWKNRLRLMCGQFDYAESGIMDNTHFRWYTFKSMGCLLTKHNYLVIMSYADGHFPLAFLRRLLPSSIVLQADKLASKLFPGLAGWQLIYISTRPQST